MMGTGLKAISDFAADPLARVYNVPLGAYIHTMEVTKSAMGNFLFLRWWAVYGTIHYLGKNVVEKRRRVARR